MRQSRKFETRLQATAFSAGGWLATLRRYIGFVAVAALVWEIAHLPRFTIWETGTVPDLIFTVLRCTGGDVLIALSVVMLALFFAGGREWPATGYSRVVIVTVFLGLSYTLFSEWLNVEIGGTRTYRMAMPVVPLLDAGLSPILQWIIIPIMGFWWARRPFKDQRRWNTSDA